MQIFARLVVWGFLGAVMSAQAENWIDVRSGPGSSFFSYDADAVSSLGDQKYFGIWRSGLSMDLPYNIYQGIVDCELESLSLERSAYVQADPIIIKFDPQPAVTDYVVGKYTKGDYSRQLTGSEKKGRNQFPSGTSPEGMFIKQVCYKQNSDELPYESKVNAFQEALGCGTAQGTANSPLCAQDAPGLEILRSLFMRLDQVQAICSMQVSEMDALVNFWLSKVKTCKGPKNCDLLLLQWEVSGLGADLGRAASNESCSYVAQSIKRMEEDKAHSQDAMRFRVCTARNIQELDDRLSPANVVAEAVYAICRTEFAPDLAKSKKFAETVIPAVTGQVLKARKQNKSKVKLTPKNR